MAADNRLNKVGIIGLGIIGKSIAEVLRKTEREIYVWNRSPKPEPNFLGSPAEMASLVGTIQIFVSDGKALLSVMEMMKTSLGPKHIVMNHSTVDPQSTLQAYEIAKTAGADFLDAPFTGSKQAAANGSLVYYIGGDRDVLERARPVLSLSAKEIIPIGRVGEATVIKIATNMISAATVEVLSEAYGLTVAAGIAPDVLLNALQHNACNSVLTSMKLPTIMSGDFSPHFSMKNMFKDAKFALELGRQFGIETPVLTTTANLMYRAIQKGHGEKDYSALALVYPQQSQNRA